MEENMFTTTSNFIALFLILTLAGCGGGGTQAVSTTSVILSADKAQAIASSRDQVAFTATIKDGSGYPLIGKTVDFNVPAGTYPYVSQGQTDANGTKTIYLKYPPLGPNRTATVTVTATSEGITSNEVTATFFNPQQAPANVTLIADKSVLLYSTTDRVILTATATDASGLPLAGQAFGANVPSGPFISGINPFTDNNGLAQIRIQPNNGVGVVPTSLAVTAIVNGVQSNEVNIAVSPPTQPWPPTLPPFTPSSNLGMMEPQIGANYRQKNSTSI